MESVSQSVDVCLVLHSQIDSTSTYSVHEILESLI